mmetsp:Transcript_40265/g.96489  ORF Transcript_40265/g.96489 Transcript_40265/m.96489 type:complete len:240 (-) Transcript_40265:342-1061(-)
MHNDAMLQGTKDPAMIRSVRHGLTPAGSRLAVPRVSANLRIGLSSYHESRNTFDEPRAIQAKCHPPDTPVEAENCDVCMTSMVGHLAAAILKHRVQGFGRLGSRTDTSPCPPCCESLLPVGRTRKNRLETWHTPRPLRNGLYFRSWNSKLLRTDLVAASARPLGRHIELQRAALLNASPELLLRQAPIPLLKPGHWRQLDDPAIVQALVRASPAHSLAPSHGSGAVPSPTVSQHDSPTQ